jgi:multidrug efflux pump subunit AcrA (membrane-fusion protein)
VIEARTQTDLSFRINGKISERIANVGDHVVKGQVLAKLDPDEQQEELVSAKASVASAEALVRQTSALRRQKEHRATPRGATDQAEADLRAAQAQLATGAVRPQPAEDQILYRARADADGIITSQNAEAGQVVAQAQPIFTLAMTAPACRVQRPDGR